MRNATIKDTFSIVYKELVKTQKSIEKIEPIQARKLQIKHQPLDIGGSSAKRAIDVYFLRVALLSPHRGELEPGDAVLLSPGNVFGTLLNLDENRNALISIEELSSKLENATHIEVRRADELFLLKNQKFIVDTYLREPPEELQLIINAIFKKVALGNLIISETDYSSSDLNTAQRKAVNAALNLEAGNFLLIHGPPGTGKTRTIAALVSELVKRDQRALITAHTNIAVDNALEKILEKRILPLDEIKRIGSVARVLPTIRQITVHKGAEDYVAEIYSALYESKVLGATLSRLGLFVERMDEVGLPKFDYVIIDEASMASIPLTLMGLIFGKKFVLVGDHKQLGPIITVKGFDEVIYSAFEILIKKYPQRSILLPIQYRSNPQIVKFISKTFYNSKLQAAPSTANKRWEIAAGRHTYSWLQLAFSQKQSLVWLDTEKLGKERWHKSPRRSSAYNYGDAALILRLFTYIFPRTQQNVANNGKKYNIAIITPFKAQSILLENALLAKYRSRFTQFTFMDISDVRTVEASQGREFDLVIYNTVRTYISSQSRDTDETPRALGNPRRLNVALSRAKRKVIVVGSGKIANPDVLQYFTQLYQYARSLNALFRFADNQAVLRQTLTILKPEFEFVRRIWQQYLKSLHQ